MNTALALADDDHSMWSRVNSRTLFNVANNRRLVCQDAATNDSVCEIFDRSQHVATSDARSQRPNNGSESRTMVRGTVRRNKATLRTEVEQGLGEALAESIPQYATPAKVVAAEIGTSTGTVDNLRQRVPDAMVTLIMIARAYPKFGSQVARLMTLDAELDPGFQREFSEFIRRAREA